MKLLAWKQSADGLEAMALFHFEDLTSSMAELYYRCSLIGDIVNMLSAFQYSVLDQQEINIFVVGSSDSGRLQGVRV